MKKIKSKKIKDKKLEKIVENFFSEEKKFYTAPYKIKDFIEGFGFEIKGKKMDDNINSIMTIDEEVEKLPDSTSNKVIIYNSSNKEEDINFILAHAFAHYIWSKSESSTPIKLDITEEYQDTPEALNAEEKFNKMASFILIPKVDFYFDLVEFKKQNNYSKKAREEFIKLAEKYKVSYALLNRRLETFKME